MYNFKEWIISLFGKLKETFLNGKKWIGYDGLLNLESSALMVIVFFVFFHYSLAVLFAVIVAGTKCYVDYKNGHQNEKHDLICSSIGIILGFILVIAILL